MGRMHKGLFRGDALTPKQKEWIGKLRDAAQQHPHSRYDAADYLGVKDNTFVSWLTFFTGKRDWPCVISRRFDELEINVPIFQRAGEQEFASHEECTRLKGQVEDWMARMDMSVANLSSISFIPQIVLDDLMRTLTMPSYSARVLGRVLRGAKAWAPPMSDQELETRKQEAEDARAAYVRKCLEEERIKYGLKKQGKPLSRMAC